MKAGKNHSDQGCHLAPSCLNCPFPVCYLDDPRAVTSHLKLLQVQQLADLTLEDAAQTLGVTVRTVLRYRDQALTYFGGEMIYCEEKICGAKVSTLFSCGTCHLTVCGKCWNDGHRAHNQKRTTPSEPVYDEIYEDALRLMNQDEDMTPRPARNHQLDGPGEGTIGLGGK